MAGSNGISEWINEAFAKIKATFVTGAGKLGIEAGSASQVAGTGMATAAEGLFSPLVLGGFAAVSAVVNQMEYNHQRGKIAAFYDEELSAKLHKPTQKVGVGDLDTLEAGDGKRGLASNNTIKEAVNQERWKRNIGIGASFVASIAAFALIHALVTVPIVGVVPLLAKVAVGVLSYMAIKAPIAATANNLLGVNKATTHEKIVEIAKDRSQGKSITREQVTEVFASGNKQLGVYVEEHFGKKYDDLALADKVAVAKELSALLPIDTITQNINAGVTNASELAFTVEGQVSGALPKSGEVREKPSMLAAFGQKCKHLAHNVTQHFHSHKPVAERAVEHAAFSNPPVTHVAPKATAKIEEESPHAGTDFVSRVGKRAGHEGLSQVERLTQARNAQIMAPSTQTVQ